MSYQIMLIILYFIATCNQIVTSNGNPSIETRLSIGKCVTLHCTLNDTVQWELNGTDVSNDTHYNINTTSGTLTIQEVRSTDTGNYTCDSGNISLIVQSKITIMLNSSLFNSYST